VRLPLVSNHTQMAQREGRDTSRFVTVILEAGKTYTGGILAVEQVGAAAPVCKARPEGERNITTPLLTKRKKVGDLIS